MSDAAQVVIDTIGGRTFRASRRTWAHLDFTVERLSQDFPACELRVIQGCYNTGVTASAGTHDYDACLDVQIVGLDWYAAQRFLRECGWAAWVRQPPAFGWHIHMVSLGYPGKVGRFVPGQVDDYYAHRTGLAGHARDVTWHPIDIASTVFDYPTWKDAHMPLNDADLKKISDLIDARLDAFVATPKVDVNGKTWSLITLWKSTWSKSKS